MNWESVLCTLRPGEEWTLHDCADLASLVWVSDTAPPSREEIEAYALEMAK